MSTSLSTFANLGLPNFAAAYRRLKMGGTRLDAQAINTAIALFEQSSGSVGGSAGGKGLINLDPADYAVPGLSTLFRIKLEVYTNATAPTSTFTASLGTLSAGTLAGAAANVSFTAGTDVASSSAPITAPAASTPSDAESSDFTIASKGTYYLKLAISAFNMVANSSAFVAIYLDVHNA